MAHLTPKAKKSKPAIGASLVVYAGMASILVAAAIPYFQHFKLKDEPFEL